MPTCVTLTCPDDSLGYNADAPDVEQNIAVSYGPAFDPPLNSKWKQLGCFAVGSSPNSQLEAALAANAESIQCAVAGWQTQTDQPILTYTNAPTSVQGTCPDGSVFTYGVVGGLFAGLTQAEADGAAMSYVQSQLLPQHIVCLGSIAEIIAASTEVSETIIASGSSVGTVAGSNHWSVVRGSLPPGITLAGESPAAGQATLAGETSQAGTYTFAIQIITPAGDYMQKTYTLQVVGLIENAPTSQYAFVTTTFQFQTNPAFTGLTFSITGGSLPPGMSLSPTGLLSGTAEAVGAYGFSVMVSNAMIAVTQLFEITVLNPITNSPPTPAARVPYSFQFTTVPGVPALSYSLASGALPTGLTLSSGGLISGTPAVAQSFYDSFTVNATDGTGIVSNQLAMTVSTPEQIVPSITGAGNYFNAAGNLPTGTYTIAYVTGALQCGDQRGGWGVNNLLGSTNAGRVRRMAVRPWPNPLLIV